MYMSQFVKDWKVGVSAPLHPDLMPETPHHTEAILTCPSDKPVTMEIKITDASLPERGKGKILIASGVSAEHEELWAVRMNNSGRIFLYLGTAGFRETMEAFDFAAFTLGLSYNPLAGTISLAISDHSAADTLTGYAANQWANHVLRHGKAPHDTWRLRLGCPQDGRADQPPIGWTISASFRFGNDLRGVIVPPPEFLERKEWERREAARQVSIGYARGMSFGRGLWPDNAVIVPPAPQLLERRALMSTDRIYSLAAEGADHRELSAEWHLGVLAGARAMGWKGGAP